MQTQQTQVQSSRSLKPHRFAPPVLWLVPDLLHGDRRLHDVLPMWWTPGVERLRIEARVEGSGVRTRVLVLTIGRDGFGSVRWHDADSVPTRSPDERRICVVPAGVHDETSDQWSLEEALQTESALLGLRRQTWGSALVSPEVRRGLRAGDASAWTRFGRILGHLMLSIVCTGGERVVLH